MLRPEPAAGGRRSRAQPSGLPREPGAPAGGCLGRNRPRSGAHGNDTGQGMKSFKNVPGLESYMSMERTERSAISSTERGRTPRTTTTAAEAHRAIEKRMRGGRGTGTSPSAGTMYMATTSRR
jgi:hypothetical protein